jgi:hypothetical protein
MSRWLRDFLAALWAPILLLVPVVAVAYFLRDSSASANFSSIAGLGLALIGFAVTIYTVLETRRIAGEAQERIQEAVRQSRAETRQAIELVGRELRRADLVLLRGWLQDLEQVARTKDWGRALLRANDCPGMVMHLSSLPGLTPEEQNDLKLAATDLREMHRFIRDNRPTGGAGDPRKDDLNKISTLTDLLDRIGGRLRAEPLEVPYAEGNQPGT